MKRMLLWSIPVIAVLGASALYFSPNSEKPLPKEAPQVPTPAPPAIRYPIEADGSPAKPLPGLTESDGAIRDALAALLGKDLEKFFNLRDIIHRIVATVDNLPRDHVSPRLMPVKPQGGFLSQRAHVRASPSARSMPHVTGRTCVWRRLCLLRRWWWCTDAFIRSFKSSMKIWATPRSISTIGSWR
jgi:hypothetical protein